MSKSSIATTDASEREAAALQAALSPTPKKKEKKITVEAALQQRRVVVDDSGRTAVRVLFISRDESLLNPEKQSLDGFLDLADMFEEVHILILREGVRIKEPVLRVAQNVWLYTAAATHWLSLTKAALDLAQAELVFAAGFRPDLIVARDPFESAFVAIKLGAKYARPVQLHVTEDYTTEEFAKKQTHYRWRKYIPRYTVPKFSSIRVATDALHAFFSKQYHPKDLSILPRFQEYRHLKKERVRLDLKSLYSQYVFLFVYAGRPTKDSQLFQAIDAARFVLRNPRVGLLILGDGPSRIECQRRAKILGIEKQVIFEKRTDDIMGHIVAADAVIAPDVTRETDEYIFAAAAAGVPAVMSYTTQRADVFEDGVSGFLCQPGDVSMFSARIGELLNNIGIRRVISQGAADAIEKMFHQDPSQYKYLYQKSIEDALFVE